MITILYSKRRSTENTADSDNSKHGHKTSDTKAYCLSERKDADKDTVSFQNSGQF